MHPVLDFQFREGNHLLPLCDNQQFEQRTVSSTFQIHFITADNCFQFTAACLLTIDGMSHATFLEP